MAEEIRAEMVANVWKVVAAAGDAVAAGDTLVILESMKMEIPVLAEEGGLLAELAVNEGDVVQEGDLIARLDLTFGRLPISTFDLACRIPRAGSQGLPGDRAETWNVSTIEPFLRALVECGGSDLHCKVGSPPRVRVDGRLRKLQTRDLTASDTELMVREVLRDDLVQEFHRTNEADFAYSVRGVGRFRVNAFRARGAAGLVFRRVSVGAIAAGRARPAGGARRARPRAARSRAGHRPDRLRQDHDAGRHGRPHQRHPRSAHRHHRGPHRGAALRQARDGQPARGTGRHRGLRDRTARRDAAGPRRHPGR